LLSLKESNWLKATDAVSETVIQKVKHNLSVCNNLSRSWLSLTKSIKQSKEAPNLSHVLVLAERFTKQKLSENTKMPKNMLYLSNTNTRHSSALAVTFKGRY